MRHDTLGEWLAWIEGLHPGAVDLSLERIARVAGDMGLDRPDCFVITVAGTNGKGSCIAMLESLLRAAGHGVGVYTSPHLLRYNERVRIDGREADDGVLCEAFARVDQARGDTSLTYFEFGTLAALDLFAAAGPDIVILETGLGGRLDAVNIIDSDLALVTAIGLDHVEWLGRDREAIGREKAGILRSGCPAVCADPQPPASLLHVAEAKGVPLYLAGRDFSVDCDHAGNGRWSWRDARGRIEDLPEPGLTGRFQKANAAAVLMLLRLLPERFRVTDAILRTVLPEVRLPGRFQALMAQVPVILDVAHNPDATSALAANLAAAPVTGCTRAVVAMLGDKDIDGMISSMAEVVDCWYVSGLRVSRAAPVDRLRDSIGVHDPACPVSVHADVTSACRSALNDSGTGDRIVVFGSFYTVSEILQHDASLKRAAD